MTISEKLNTIAENQQKIYEAGQKSIGATETVTGNPVQLDYVHPTEHEINVQLKNKNKFNVSRIESYGTHLVNNGDGTITVNTSAGSTGVGMGNANKTLGNLVPELEAGKTYTLSATTTGTSKFIYLSGANYIWNFGTAKLITEIELNSEVIFYASGLSTTATISNIQIEEGTAATPYTPHLTDFSGVKVWRHGKNLLRLDGREVVDFGGAATTEKRAFTGNGIVVGVTRSNHYVPNRCADAKVEGGAISGTTINAGYGLGFDVRVLPNTKYAVSYAEITGDLGIGQYNANGEYLTYAVVSNVDGTFTTRADTAWCLIVFLGNAAGQSFNVVCPQIEIGTVATVYEPGVVPTEHTANADGTVKGVKSVSPTTVLVADGVVLTAEYCPVSDYQYHRFWDVYQEKGKRIQYANAFGGLGWTSQTLCPKYDIKPTGTSYNMFMYSGFEGDLAKRLKDCGVVLDTSKAPIIYSMFANAGKITRVPRIDITSSTNSNGLFSYCGLLVTIDTLVVGEKNTNLSNAFVNCKSLVDLTIEGTIVTSVDLQFSPLLSRTSILSVFNALSATKTGQTVIFNKAAVNAAFTDEEWNALIATKTNWSYGLI